jgi:hypothetical protein
MKNQRQRVNEQADFTAYEAVPGEVYIENSEGEIRLIISSSGSDEHGKTVDWLLNAACNDDLKSEFANAKPE